MKKTINGKEGFVYEIRTEHSLWGDDKHEPAQKLYNKLTETCKKNSIDADLSYSSYHCEISVSDEYALSIIKTLESLLKKNKFKLTGFEVRVSVY